MSTDNAPLELLLALADHRQDADTTRADIERLIATADFDWGQFFALALFHKVAFLAWTRLWQLQSLETVLSAGMPLLLFNHWTQLHRVNECRTAAQFEALRAISQGLNGAEVRWMVGKGGPLLLGTCYPPGARKMYDLDLLAGRDDLDAIVSGMGDAGFSMGYWSPDKTTIDPLHTGELRNWLLHSRGLPNFLALQDDPVIDYLVAQVQFRVGSTATGGQSVAAERLLDVKTTTTMTWGVGTSFSVPSPSAVDLCIQLALHIARETIDPEHSEWHMSWNIIKLTDLARYVDATDFEIEALASRSAELGFREQVRYAIAAVSAVFPSERVSKAAAVLGVVSMPTLAELSQEFLAVADARTRSQSTWTTMVGVKTS
ncbi:hypothetical protein QFZ53_002721 [Microbacterium natoriense]|uniref:Nucleotidyltransferase family protein n=1 Tax=Microbacterium natoriense TaxID=284570 RepID=A0AAW8EYH9_9MICO|nr:nucleotidyltransferase family protein [Microbacterium natoriense]MDQ0648525.1 hypothetical protein [Microbacterium natoriense]